MVLVSSCGLSFFGPLFPRFLLSVSAKYFHFVASVVKTCLLTLGPLYGVTPSLFKFFKIWSLLRYYLDISNIQIQIGNGELICCEHVVCLTKNQILDHCNLYVQI